jgi:hypothetical protein
MSGRKGFLASLFDLSFASLIGTRVIAFLYVVALIAGALLILTPAIALVGGTFRASFSSGATVGLVVLVLSPLLFGLYAIATRFQFELLVALFRIADNTSRMAYYAQADSRQGAAEATPVATPSSEPRQGAPQ